MCSSDLVPGVSPPRLLGLLSGKPAERFGTLYHSGPLIYDQIGVLGEQVSVFTKVGITFTGLYLACICGIMQFFPALGARKDDPDKA